MARRRKTPAQPVDSSPQAESADMSTPRPWQVRRKERRALRPRRFQRDRRARFNQE